MKLFFSELMRWKMNHLKTIVVRFKLLQISSVYVIVFLVDIMLHVCIIILLLMTLDGAESVDIREIIEDIPTVRDQNPRKRKHFPTEQQQTNVKTSR